MSQPNDYERRDDPIGRRAVDHELRYRLDQLERRLDKLETLPRQVDRLGMWLTLLMVVVFGADNAKLLLGAF